MDRFSFLKKVESNARTYAANFPQVFERGQGVRLRDSRGHEVIDCLACAGALPLGHNHPEVTEAVLRFLSSGQVQQALDMSTPAKFEWVSELLTLLPEEFSAAARLQFCSPSGSDAVEAALKLTRFATQRQTVIAFDGAYHGMTNGSLGAMGNLLPKSGIGHSGGGIHFAPFPNKLHCPFGSDGSESEFLAGNYLRTMLTDPESGIPKPAALIVEVVQGEGGCNPAPLNWLRAIRKLTSELRVPMIVDEVQTGLARTGQMFGFQHAGIVPDVVVLSKAIGGGYPLAVVAYHESLDVWPRGMHAGTFRGNQIAMVAGLATMNIVRRDRLDQAATRIGALLAKGLWEIAGRYPFLADVRGLGLMLGVEVLRSGRGSKCSSQDGELARSIQMAAFRNGLLFETGGRFGSVLRFLPALILTESDVGAILDRFESSVASASRENTIHAN
jgi:diaminobutyrate-2-oxoglutarate transaminase